MTDKTIEQALEREAKESRTENLQRLLEEQKAFSQKTFGDRSFTGPLHHLLKEVNEVLDASEHGAALTEFADCFLLLLDAYWRRFPYWQSQQLLSAAFNKLEVNKKRKWGPPDANGASQHIEESQPSASEIYVECWCGEIPCKEEQAAKEKAGSAAQEWQVCPKCNGKGYVSTEGLSTSVHEKCPVCSGAKVLLKPSQLTGGASAKGGEEDVKEWRDRYEKFKDIANGRDDDEEKKEHGFKVSIYTDKPVKQDEFPALILNALENDERQIIVSPIYSEVGHSAKAIAEKAIEWAEQYMSFEPISYTIDKVKYLSQFSSKPVTGEEKR